MKQLRIFISVCLLSLSPVAAFSQYWNIDDLMKLKPSGIGTQRVDTNYAIYLPMPFAEASFTDISQLAKIPSSSSIYAVHLVYTRFREVDTFNQPELNLHRFNELKKVYPQIFEQQNIQWKVLEQREARTKEKAAQCFHGFVIYLKNEPPPELVAKEVSTITDVVGSYTDTLIWVPEKIDWKVKKRKVETGYYLPRNKEKKKEGTRYKSSSLGLRDKEYDVFYDSTIRKKTGGYWKKIGQYDTSVFKGTDEFNFLTRRKWSSKMVVVTDVTGSMSPFTTQVMLWLKFSPDVLKQGRFVFFNDGDGTPDAFKRIGSSGGIYFASSGDFDSVFTLMTQTMQKGLGGDIPENDLEAVLSALKRWPDTDTILLIADNQAAVKDISLLSKIDRPVSVMVCGMFDRIHPDYINIVKTTGGRLFVLDTEIANLKGMQTGTRILIGSQWYRWEKGTFVLVNQ